ncbi:flagellar basal body P-ring formation protein FlgA [Microvirga tunisiensis]|uniref:Flagellar basal body P-ring formation protein FlgA n=2 Tax=Pannonibacter tanglangensis TaxID=2750084 RepID=A0A7X5J8E9_9HYPH|nr:MULTISPECIES: flagellar basal body P-ring formation chaperone FlgA [unclassified Pannonibacter]NBN63538.1 flagellar basal body P-ring formation protein FlgA [Pannonibacter sp. XCT-34]NBN77175.1 flagellar basal body P-ring formation protein FlgA [Pannonibacter sp. XCT-53]
MRRFVLAGLALLASALAAVQALALEAPVLRSQVAVSSDVVTVGDFYSNAGLLANVPLFRSPDLGHSGRVPADVVAERARAAGLSAAGTDGLRDVLVERQSIVLDADRLSALVAGALAGQAEDVRPEDLDIAFARTPQPVHVDPAAGDPVRIEQALWSRADGRFDVTVEMVTAAGPRKQVISGVAREMVSVLTLAQPLERGQIVSADDFTVMRLPRSRVPARSVTDPAEVAGLAARSNMRPGRPLSRSDFERPQLIARGDQVTLVYEVGAMRLTTKGQALAAGAEGDLIDIVNTQSRRTVTGTVIGRGQVRVGTAPRTVAALDETPAKETAQ